MSMMATTTTLDMGEPVDERSVDGSPQPRVEDAESGDRDKYLRSDPNYVGAKESQLTYAVERPSDFIKTVPTAVQEQVVRCEHVETYTEFDEEEGAADYESEFMDEDEKVLPEFQITPHDFYFRIAPAVGAVCYEYFSLKIMNPEWFSRAFGSTETAVINALWLQARLGTGLYVYSRKHLRTVPVRRRILYSTLASLLFNYGSCHIWLLVKWYLPNIPQARVIGGLLSGGMLLYLAHDYMHFVDSRCSEID